MNGESEKLYFKTAPPPERRPKEIACQVKEMTMLVEFTHPELCAQTHPVNCLINGRAVIPDKQNWSRLLTAITERFIQDKNPNLGVLDRKPIYGSKAFFMPQKVDCGTSSKLSNGKWIYTNYNPQTIVTIIGNLCRHCGVSLNNILITYAPKDSYVLRRMTNHAILTKTKNVVGNKIKDAVLAILEQHFQNGIRPSSIIDINKLKNYYRVTSSEELPSEIEISSFLYEIGIQHKDKVFVISSRGKKDLIKLLEGLIAEDNRLFYYKELYNVHTDFLQAIHIFSPELLKTLLSESLPSLCYSRKCFSIEDCVTLESEVLRCYDTAICLSYDQLKERLPYVPIEKIKQVLAQNQDFIWVDKGIYTHSSKIEIDEHDLQTVEAKIEVETSNYSYVSLAALNVLESLGLNIGLSEAAVKKGLFYKYLADRYEKRGNIITPKGTVLNSMAVFADYCRSYDRLKLDELLEFERELNGKICNQSLFVAYDTMVRIDKDTFISEGEIKFHVEPIDNALARFVKKDVIPLWAVKSFTLFPYVDGYPWNLFLLESYCRRFSNLFKYQCLSVNSKNVGAIFRKSAGFTDYPAVLAYAVANSHIRLSEKEVGDYLFENGYIARRTGIISNVITQARMLRERLF